MTEEDEVILAKLETAYKKEIEQNLIPKSSDISRFILYRIEVESLSLAYGEHLKECATDKKIHEILSRRKDIHIYEGSKYFECQNKMFQDWYTYQKIKLLECKN